MKPLRRALSILMSAVLMASLCALPAEAEGLTLGEPTPLTQENAGVPDTTRGNALLHNGYFTQDIQWGIRSGPRRSISGQMHSFGAISPCSQFRTGWTPLNFWRTAVGLN